MPNGATAGGSSAGVLRRPVAVMAMIGLVGALVTAALSWTAWRIDRNNEHRLLQVQTKQAANLISLAIVTIQSPLESSIDVASATNGSVEQFDRFMAAYTGPNATFTSASLWQLTGPTPVLRAATGSVLSPPSSVAALVARARLSSSFVVMSVTVGGQQRIGFARADPKDPIYAVYAERAIPANRRVPVENDSAFSDLHFASYLGTTTDTAALQTTDVAPNRLPLSGTTDRQTIPFGDTTVTLVTSPIGHLGGSLSSRLPWILVIGGILFTAAAVFVGGQLVRRRRDAEHASQTITGLYEQLDTLFSEQRTISETLQNALLPQTNPSIPSLEIATRYVAGARGVDIGGDWYSIILVDDTHFGFVVGDVSGRGVEAAAIMARIRFTLRAYLVEGHAPAAALQMCSSQLDVRQDGHFATVLVGLGDLSSRHVTIANAGHLNPLILSGGQAQFIQTVVGPPLGVTTTAYPSVTVAMPAGSTLLAFTDGLVERRDEDLDVGLQRLADTAARLSDRPVSDLVADVLATLTEGGGDDDIAILAYQWSVDAD